LIKEMKAEKVFLAPVEGKINVDNDFIRFVHSRLKGKTLKAREKVSLLMLGQTLYFMVIETAPKGSVLIDEETNISISGEPADEYGKLEARMMLLITRMIEDADKKDFVSLLNIPSLREVLKKLGDVWRIDVSRTIIIVDGIIDRIKNPNLWCIHKPIREGEGELMKDVLIDLKKELERCREEIKNRFEDSSYE